MSRILDFLQDPPHEVVSRIVMQVHRTIDEHFPGTGNQSKRFSKTVFASEDTKVETGGSKSGEVSFKSAEEKKSLTQADDEQAEKHGDFIPSEFASLPPLSLSDSEINASKQQERIDTSPSLKSQRASIFKRIFYLLLFTLFLGVLFAFWAQHLLLE